MLPINKFNNSTLKLVLIILLSLCFGCRMKLNSEEKALRSIRLYMRDHLNDYNSYEPVSTKLDSFFLTGLSVSERVAIEKHYNDSILRVRMNSGDSSCHNDNTDSVIKARSRYVVFSGWTAYQKFRSKNAFGAMVIGYYRFDLDTMFQVTNVYDMDEPATIPYSPILPDY